MSSQNKFDATGPLAGYIYQIRLALFLALKEIKRDMNGQITIEKFDDIAFEKDGNVKCLYQAKHSIAQKKIDDKSIDFWKTIRIWINHFKQKDLIGVNTSYLLITNATAPDNSALSKLRANRSEANWLDAGKILKDVAESSHNKATEAARAQFLSLKDHEIDNFLSSIFILDKCPNLLNIRTDIEGELYIIAPDHYVDVANELEGWWLNTVAERLARDNNKEIALLDVLMKANSIGRSYGPTHLPTMKLTEFKYKPYSPEDENEIYVKQMRLIKLSEENIIHGIQDYYKATTQRSLWIRKNLLVDGEIDEYDAKLKDLWDTQRLETFDNTKDMEEKDKCKIGKDIFFWANKFSVKIRNVDERWLTAGSFQKLSNQLKVGWHPHFEQHFQKEDDDEKS